MRSMPSYLLLFFMVMFWVFRIVVSFTTTMGIDIGFTTNNLTLEIILLFVTMVSIALVGKRLLSGSILYLLTYGAYFGFDVVNAVIQMIQGTSVVTDYSNMTISFIGVILPLAIFFNMLFDRNRTNHPVDKKTDWFYKNEEYDRKVDERADQNEYRNY